MNGAARLMKEASPTPTSLQKNCCESQIKTWHEKLVNYQGSRLYNVESTETFPYIRHIAIDQKSNEQPHPAIANVQTDNPTPISRNGLWLQTWKCINHHATKGETWRLQIFNPTLSYLSLFEEHDSNYQFPIFYAFLI